MAKVKKTQHTKILNETSWENELGGKPMKILYMNEDGFLITPDHFKQTQTALIIYAVKKDSDSALVGGTMPLYSNNEHQLADFNEDEWLKLTSSTENGETTIVVDGAGISYARVMIVESNIELNIPH